MQQVTILDSRKSKEISQFPTVVRREEGDRNGWLSGIRKTFRPSFHYPDPIVLYSDWLSVSRTLAFPPIFQTYYKIISIRRNSSIGTIRRTLDQKFELLSRKITRDACKNCTRQCSFFFFLFQRSERQP